MGITTTFPALAPPKIYPWVRTIVIKTI